MPRSIAEELLDDLEPRMCACGCERTFFCLPGSKALFYGYDHSTQGGFQFLTKQKPMPRILDMSTT